MKPELLVMAAGMGSRFGGLKQLEPVGPSGEKVMDYGIYDAKKSGIERVVFVIRRDFENEFHMEVGSKYRKWMEVDYAFQELTDLPSEFAIPEGRQKPWGTAHAILSSRHVINNPFIAMNADDFYGRNAFSLLANWLSKPVPSQVDRYAMVAFRLTNTLSANGTVTRGICEVDELGMLKSVEECLSLEATEDAVRDIKPDGSSVFFSGNEPVSMNFWGFQPTLFGHLEELFIDFLHEHGQEQKSEFYIPVAVDNLIRAGKADVQVLSSPDPWFGVTHREDKELVVSRIQELVKSGEYPHSLWS
ncbi:MAG: sugar phosphate nucleotidyltransferase [Holophagaceae bacterium]|nr:sugar phosphate nucleotidyltransferase [Holophagaceae bacterium]